MKPNKIAHLSDIHWFLIKSHEQLKEAQIELIKILKDEKIDLTVLGGDIVDSKNHLSPEQIKNVREFFLAIADITPIVLIPGNHDLDLSSPGREDSLTDIVETVNNLVKPKNHIFYLTESKIYDLFDINWAHWSVFEDQKSPFKENYVLKNDLTIGLFHGPVGTILLENSMQRVSDVQLDIFNKCDLVMLGDIHLRQSFRNEEIYYPGSWCELSFGEAEIWKNDFLVKESRKGMLIWEYNNQTYKPRFKEINIENGYKIIQVENFDTFKYPIDFIKNQKQKVRLDYIGDKKNYSKQKINEIKKEIQKLTEQKIIFRFEPKEITNSIYSQKLSGVINHDQIFVDYFKSQLDEKGKNRFSDTEIKLLKDIDNEINKMIDINNVFSQGQYQLESLTIHNFISFGENNKINFKDKKGLVGILGENRIGKSSIFEAICFCLFDEIIRNNDKAKFLVNDQRNEDALVELIFWVNGIKYKIRRTIKVESNSKVDFFEFLPDGTEKIRNGKTKTLTDSEILKVVGDKEIFLILALSSQRNPFDFVDNNNKDRLEILKKILGVLIYNQKENKIDEIRKEQINEIDFQKKELQRYQNSEDLEKKNIENQKIIFQNIQDLEYIVENIQSTNEIISLLSLEKEKNQRNITTKNRKESTINFDLEFNKGVLDSLNEEKQKITERKNKSNSSVESFKQNNINVQTFESNKEELFELKGKMSEFNLLIKNEKDKLKEENVICEHCQIVIKQIDKDSINQTIQNLENQKSEISNKFDSLSKLDNEILSLQKEILKIEKEEISNQSEIKEINSKIEALENELNDNKKNSIYEKEITDIEEKISLKKKSLEILQAKELDLNLKINKLENENEKNLETIQKHFEISQKIESLELELNYIKEYQRSVHRTGIPSLILSTYIPLINYEVNNYLNDIFDFKVEFDLQEGELEVYYLPKDSDISTRRNISMASGSENFIMNQAIRATMNKISYFVKPDFLMIDEGFGTLDNNNIENVKNLLTKLEQDFSLVLIISHEESMKASLMKTQINLIKENGVTQIL